MYEIAPFNFALLDHIPIGVMVLRRDMSVVFWNSTLEEWTSIPRENIIGTNIANQFPNLQSPIYAVRLESVFGGGPPVVFSSQLHQYVIPAPFRNEQLRIQHTIVTAVPAPNSDEFFALFAMQDVTELTQRIQEYRGMRDQAIQEATARQHAQEAEHQQRVLAEALRDITAVLNSTLQLDEVLNHILANVGRVIQYDLVDLMLVENGIARLVRSHRRDAPDVGEALPDLQLEIANTPNLRQMSETCQPLVIPEVSVYPGWIDMPQTRWIRSYAGAPIIIRGQVVGFLGKSSHTPGFFSKEQKPLLQAFADQAAIAIANARLYAEVQRSSVTDELTGLYNRRGLFELGEREIERALRFNHSLTAIMFDIDHFKKVNDQYGHPIGDRMLRALADSCRQQIRSVDIAGRYGGEEFVILLPETDKTSGAHTAERLRQVVAQTQLAVQSETRINVTVSLGVAVITPKIITLSNLLACADKALYIAKQNGRNCVAVFDDK
jgi:diguanylate cyclase (GGDEF)-like protein